MPNKLGFNRNESKFILLLFLLKRTKKANGTVNNSYNILEI